MGVPVRGSGRQGAANGLWRVAPRRANRLGAQLTQVESFLRTGALVGRVGLEPTADGL